MITCYLLPPFPPLLAGKPKSLPTVKPPSFPQRRIRGTLLQPHRPDFPSEPLLCCCCLSVCSVNSFPNKCLTLSSLSQCLSVGSLMQSVIPTSGLPNPWSPGIRQTLSMYRAVPGRAPSDLEVVKSVYNAVKREGNLQKSVLAFHHMGPGARAQTQVVRLGGKCRPGKASCRP